MGTVRTLEDYELYAGINFKLNLLHPDAVIGKNPPVNDYTYNWAQANTQYNFKLNIPAIDMTDVQFLCICIEDTNNVNLYRKDLMTYVTTLNVDIKTHTTPDNWIFWPNYKSSGWGEKQVFKL
jgi:hypothetical protein